MNNKIYKPGECTKYMNVEIHPALLEAWYCADIQREVSSLGARVVPPSDLCEPGVVVWSRTLEPELINNAGQMQLASTEQCDIALYVQCAEEAATHINTHTWSQHVKQIRDKVGRRTTVVVFGVEDYFKKSGGETNNSHRNLMNEDELEMAITDLIISTDCNAMIVNTPTELALLIAQFTKAIAEAPHKKAQRAVDEQAEFYMRDKKKPVAVDEAGNGVAQLWQQQVAMLPSSSLEIARAVCAEYKCPSEFFEALKQPNIVSSLADIEVSRSGAPDTRPRRLGSEFARRLYTLFTADDRDVLLE